MSTEHFSQTSLCPFSNMHPFPVLAQVDAMFGEVVAKRNPLDAVSPNSGASGSSELTLKQAASIAESLKSRGTGRLSRSGVVNQMTVSANAEARSVLSSGRMGLRRGRPMPMLNY